MEEITMGRKLVDMQYHYDTDSILVHEIVDGERKYSFIDKPKLYFGVLDTSKEGAKPFIEKINKAYFVPAELMKWYNVPYKTRHEKLLEMTGYEKQYIKSLSSEQLRELKKECMANPYLYYADNSIEFQEKINYSRTFKDEIDSSIKLHVCSFDIEVHDFFNTDIFVHVRDNIIEKNCDLSYYLSLNHQNIISNVFNKHRNKLLESSINTLDDIYNFIDSDFVKNTVYQDYYIMRIVPYGISKYVLNESPENYNRERLQELLNLVYETFHRMDYTTNVGFPDEEVAPSAVDAISLYSDKESKMYMYLVHFPFDTSENCAEKFEEYHDALKYYLNAMNMKIFINNDKSFRNDNKELVEKINESLTNKPYERIDELVKEVELKIGKDKFETIFGFIDLEIKTFENEASLLGEFFRDLRFNIQPNVLLAHNVKFDFLTLYNRLYLYYRTNPNLYFSQVGPFFTDSPETITEPFTAEIRLSHNTTNKRDNTYFDVPGLVVLDSQSLIAKTSFRERDFSLNAVCRDYLKETKFEYEGTIQELYRTDTKDFIFYSAIDTLLVHKLNEYLDLVGQFDTIVSNTFSKWSEHPLKSAYITNTIKYEVFQEYNLVTQNNRRKVVNEESDGFEGAYVTDPVECQTYGIHEDVYDGDASSQYPYAIISANTMTDKLIGQFVDIDMYREYLQLDKLQFFSKHFNTDPVETLMEKL